MRIEDLITHLPDSSISEVSLSDAGAEVFTVSFLTLSSQEIRSDVLYFGDSTLLPHELPPQTTFNCVLFGSAGACECFEDRCVNLIELAADVDPFECHNAVQGLFIEERKQVAVTDRMLQAHFSNKGLQYLIEEAASAFGNPIVVVDTTFRYIAYHLAELEGQDSELARSLTDEVRSQTVVEEAITYIRNEGIDQQVAQAAGPLVCMNPILCAKTMTSAVTVRGICMAHIMMIEHDKPFQATDSACFEKLTGFVAQEMQKSELWSPTAGEMGSFFLSSLLNDRSPSEAVTFRRLKALNFHPKPTLEVICLHGPGEGLGQLDAEHIAGQLKPMLHHAIYTRFHRQLVVLVSRDEKTCLDPFTEHLLTELCSLNDLTCGISNPYERIVDTRSAYDQARRAVRYGNLDYNAFADRPLYRYHDYACQHAFEICDNKTNLLSLCHPALLDLRLHDEKHGGDLMDTLFCYLEVAGSTARASKLLNLHKNTLLYRLGRIRKILDVSLTSGEDLFLLQYSFHILIFLELYKPRISFDRTALRENQ